jgi:hypothetical protein
MVFVMLIFVDGFFNFMVGILVVAPRFPKESFKSEADVEALYPQTAQNLRPKKKPQKSCFISRNVLSLCNLFWEGPDNGLFNAAE